ncbi:DUF3304 domain-containing protein [Cupriavidus sp. DL-D2]|uniref:DUF3304 domain-containing protein n=1 Tax=Cupriavidus sp. DL-D2 TaxID=3144974 RepID=UPI00321209D1
MNARHEIARHGKVDQKIPPSYLKALTIALATAFLLGCSDGDPMRRSAGSPAATYELAPVVNPGGVSGLNYTPHYIVRFGITGENGMRGGGPNIRRAEGDGPAGGGAETCCIGIPEVWKPDMKVTIRWGAEKVADGKTPATHYVAEARVQEYARRTAGMWAIFLPDNRVKVMVRDGNANGRNSLDVRPADVTPMWHRVLATKTQIESYCRVATGMPRWKRESAAEGRPQWKPRRKTLQRTKRRNCLQLLRRNADWPRLQKQRRSRKRGFSGR